jgi:hypothetical protein
VLVKGRERKRGKREEEEVGCHPPAPAAAIL